MTTTFDETAFAIERSNNAAKAANENSRPMAQYALLINGAAATALIAVLSKDRIEPALFYAISKGISFYVIGVVSAAIAMYCMTTCLDEWNSHWESIARNEPANVALRVEEQARKWWGLTLLLFGFSIFCFVVGSGFLAWYLLQMEFPAPTPITC